MQVGRKAQGQDMSLGEAGTKAVACGLGHTSSNGKTRVRQGARRACAEVRNEA
jgi:Fe-S cluster assembly scaffold protein SufB